MPTTPAPGDKKPYLKLAQRLVFFGIILFGLEQFGLSKLGGPNKGIHLDPNLLAVLVLLPLGLVLAGAIVFVVGRMRRL
jgi:hypothetical protein